MKAKRILEEIVTVKMCKNNNPDDNCSVTAHYIDGQKVAEDIFKKEQKRVCLKNTRRSTPRAYYVYNGPNPPICVDEITSTTIQYVPLPFYHKK